MGEQRRCYPIIGGERVPGRTRPVVSPFDGRTVGEVDHASSVQVSAAIAAAVRAVPAMRALPAHERAAALQRMVDLLRQRADALADALCDEAGKPIQYARAEVTRCQQTFAMAAAEAARLTDESVALDAVPAGAGRFGIVRRFPIGAIAAISPFNFPLNLSAHKVAPALAAGCSVVLKPASRTPLTPCLLGEIGLDAGLPAGAFNVVPTDRAAADQMIGDPRLKLITFTGSPAVGWDLKARAGRQRVVLELGGNAAAVVHSDADLAWAVDRIASGAFAYAGQVCISVQRVLLHAPIYEAFAARFLDQVRQRVPYGDPRDDKVVVGPLIDGASADRLLSWIEEARQGGARVLCGGGRSGNVVTPCVLEKVPRQSHLGSDEAFGPVVALESYRDWSEAIRKANDTRYGLQCGVFSNDLAGVWRCFQEIEVGGVIHNDAPTFRVDQMPYGGIKDSGLGREGIRYAIEDMTERKLLALYPRP
ncbi:MAG: aldehyde dehydrogenase family protein [Deltaproteobacteria bacterium]|nr:aldehyde dehydrogenase family protein [Deltaproteobacteria bacterium]